MNIKERVKELEGSMAGLVIYCIGVSIGVLIGYAMWGIR